MRHIATNGIIRLTVFKSGSVVHWPVVGTKPALGDRPPRGIITDMSVRSRLRAAWMFANAECDWGMMATLTYRTAPDNPKDHLKRFERMFRNKFGHDALGGWIMEFQARGVVHFHLFFPASFVRHLQLSSGYHVEPVYRDGIETFIVRGPFDEWLQRRWRWVVGDQSPEFARFQNGGIIELLRSPDAAARYIAKEAGKRAQKDLPEGMSPQGRWWWLNPHFKPRPRAGGVLERWPYDHIYKLIFDTADALKKEKTTPRERSLHVTTSYNICVAKAQATISSQNGPQPAKLDRLDVRVSDLPDNVPPQPSELFAVTDYGTPDCTR